MESPLNKLLTAEKKAIDCGFVWPNSDMALDQLISEAHEVRQAIGENESRERIQEEIGDLIHASLSLCIFMKFDVEETLIQAGNKFEKRLSKMLKIAQEQGYSSLKNQPTEVLLHLWELAKQQA